MQNKQTGPIETIHDLNAYDYFLPEHLIAQIPKNPRDASRLLVVNRKEGKWEHRVFRDLPNYLDYQDLIIANNTRVLKARLLGHRIREEKGTKVRGGKVEFVLLEEHSPRCWEGLFHASAKYVPGLQFEIPTPDGLGLKGTLIRGSAESPTGTVVAEFDRDPGESGAGEIPLPHYIERQAGTRDEISYQTVYTKKPGSAAAPTAGLHFTQKVVQELLEKGVEWEEVTLHVGLGTFRPVKEQDIRKHVMHEERYEVDPQVAQKILAWKRAGKRIVAVGTTSARTLESASFYDSIQGGSELQIRSGIHKTSLFIKPGDYQFKVVDRLLTNFHLPKSTLLMLVSAFSSRELILAAYEDAVREKYRFFSYGDAMLIL